MEPIEWLIFGGIASAVVGTAIVSNGVASGLSDAEQKVAQGVSIAAMLAGVAIIVYAVRKTR